MGKTGSVGGRSWVSMTKVYRRLYDPRTSGSSVKQPRESCTVGCFGRMIDLVKTLYLAGEADLR